MDAVIDFCIQWGYLGIFLSALIAGSAIPFSSEVVLVALIHPATGLSPLICILVASLGNMFGSLTCYWIGTLGKVEWLEKYFRIRPERIERMRRYLNGKGVYMAFFSFFPVFGEVISATLGLMRTNVYAVTTIIFLGKLTRYTLVVLAALGVFSLTSCRQTSPPTERTLTVTVEPQRYFTEAVAGNRFKVVCMVPKGVSPETYDPTPSQLVALSRSEAYLRIGYIGFETTWMERLTDNHPQLRVFDTSEGIDLIRSDDSVHDHEGEATPSHFVEPHVWTSPANARTIVANTCRALTTLDPDGKAYYEARRDSIDDVIAHTDSLIAALLDTAADRAFLIFHPALTYFARDYDLLQVAIEEEGRAPSPAYLKQLIDVCRFLNIRTIFVQPEFDTHQAQLIAAETDTRIVRIYPLAYEWQAQLLRVAEALRGE
jgi:ABC-type Zn uptake system ZnuABC Zn-binding protein ZnuA